VDFVFKQAPETISVDSHSAATKKIAFNVTDLDANGVAVAWFEEGKADEAAGALRRALAAQPCSALVRGNLIQVLTASGRKEEVADEARKWVFECPDSGVEAHRAYQEAEIALGKRDALLTEYKARLDATPGSGLNHYLYARLLHDPAQSTPHYQEALRLEPGLWWGRVGLAYDLMAQERDAEAAENLEQVLRTPGHDEAADVMYAMASIGAGSAAHASEILDSLDSPSSGQAGPPSWQARWLLLLARGDFSSAARRLEARSREAGEQETWGFRTQLFRLQGDDAALKKAIAEGRLQPEKAGLAGTLRQERALAAGNWSEAVAALEGLKPEDVSPADRLLAAWALQMSGDREQAGQRLAALEAELASNAQDPESAAFLAMTRHLEGRESADAVLAAARRAGFNLLPHAYFALAAAREAAGDAAGARALYEKSRRATLDFSVPYAAAAARAKEAPAGSGV
jgi:thioredoxin-like negative regulator of GroEL